MLPKPNNRDHFYLNGQTEENSTVLFVIADCTHLEQEFKDLEILGILVFGDKKKVDSLTKDFPKFE